MQTMILTAPPHARQVPKSMPHTCLRPCAQVMAPRHSMAVLGLAEQRTLRGMTVFAEIIAVQKIFLNGEGGSVSALGA
jgi:hypothetical protein